MTVRDETAETPSEVHGAKNNERHACGRRRAGGVLRAEPRGAEAYLKQYVEVERGEPARLGAETCTQACRSGVSAVAVEAFMNNVG